MNDNEYIIEASNINFIEDMQPIDEVCVNIGTDYEERIPCISHVYQPSLISAIAIIAKLHERVKELEEKIKDD